MVQRESRHCGIGQQLMEAAREFFEAQGVRYFTLYTSMENKQAISFYKQNGLAALYTTMIGEIQSNFHQVGE